MIQRFKDLSERYYNFWLRLANLPKKTRLFSVNFDKSWLHVITARKFHVGLILVFVSIIQTFYAIYPIFLSKAIESGNYTYFFYFLAFWLFIVLLDYGSIYLGALLEVECINSVLYSSFKHFLTIDPLYHTMKSTGKLFAKIERCARSYEDFFDIILWEITPVIISIIAVTITFLYYHITLGLTALVLLVVIASLNIALNLFTSFAFERKIIQADDSLKSLSIESLTQVQLIRSSFATNEITNLTKDRVKNLMYVGGTGWLAFASSATISRLAYLGSILILGLIVFDAIKEGTLSPSLGSAILFAYLNGTYEIIEIGRRLRKLLRATTRITDLYSFIQMFGKKTYPVLEASKIKPITTFKEGIITIEARDIEFYYNPRAKIFDNHNLYLEVAHDQPKKLYGIIGPSGMGKTTLLSLLGGQLKPDKGTVLVNGVPIYKINDMARRSLITMQGQVASSLSGTVKSNLLLGLPQNRSVYTNEEIIQVLMKVGIWAIFDEKQGLETPVGEAGLTLSGGQRQRLNFASLYLRAHYFNPVLILIDEPTSSLDELSEQAITTMISQLAEKALTIVIAHRLKTLDDAVGIIDFSLLDDEKDITFYSRDELEKKSIYYKKLMQGDVPIDE